MQWLAEWFVETLVQVVGEVVADRIEHILGPKGCLFAIALLILVIALFVGLWLVSRG